MDYLNELWEKSGCPIKPTQNDSIFSVIVVDTYKQLSKMPVFTKSTIKRLNVVRTSQNNNKYIYIVEFFGTSSVDNEVTKRMYDKYIESDEIPITFVVSLFDKDDLVLFKNLIINNDIKTFGNPFKPTVIGQVPGLGTDGLKQYYTKDDIERKMRTFIGKNEFSISASTISKLTNWVNEEF